MSDWSVWRAAVGAHREGHLGGRPGVPVPVVNAALWELLDGWDDPVWDAEGLVDLVVEAIELLCCGEPGCGHDECRLVRDLAGVVLEMAGLLDPDVVVPGEL